VQSVWDSGGLQALQDGAATRWPVAPRSAPVDGLNRMKLIKPAVPRLQDELPAYDVAVADHHSGKVIFDRGQVARIDRAMNANLIARQLVCLVRRPQCEGKPGSPASPEIDSRCRSLR
jgi:hypothetical protein